MRSFIAACCLTTSIALCDSPTSNPHNFYVGSEFFNHHVETPNGYRNTIYPGVQLSYQYLNSWYFGTETHIAAKGGVLTYNLLLDAEQQIGYVFPAFEKAKIVPFVGLNWHYEEFVPAANVKVANRWIDHTVGIKSFYAVTDFFNVGFHCKALFSFAGKQDVQYPIPSERSRSKLANSIGYEISLPIEIVLPSVTEMYYHIHPYFHKQDTSNSDYRMGLKFLVGYKF